MNAALRNYLRVRGEYGCGACIMMGVRELPPRARRIRGDMIVHRQIGGTTSACAENTSSHHSMVFCGRNYLRVRGEYGPGVPCTGDQGELPPRARRIRWAYQQANDCSGTTSACAENTPTRPASANTARNYLRVRGEYDQVAAELQSGQELPPRARRIPVLGQVDRVNRGTTSACAENTVNSKWTIRSVGNYLRVRGEYIFLSKKYPPTVELPPRARRIRTIP